MTPDELGSMLEARLLRVLDGEPGTVFDPSTIALVTQLAALAEPDHDNLPVPYLLGMFHWLRYRQLPRGHDRDDALGARRWFVRLLPWQPELIPSALIDELAADAPPAGRSADDWSDESVRLQESTAAAHVAILNRAVELARRAVAAVGPDEAVLVSRLGVALLARYDRTGQLADLDEAVAVARQAAATTPVGHPERVLTLNNLGLGLLRRFERIGDIEDLNESVETIRLAIAGEPPDSTDVGLMLSNLCLALRDRFERTGDQADLDQAIAAGQRAVTAAAPDDPGRARYLVNLGGARYRRFERTGDLTDLDSAIDTLRESSTAIDQEHAELAGILATLGLVLRHRFERIGDQADLDEAIEILQRAVTVIPPGHPNLAMCLANLSTAALRRFERTGGQADLDQAIMAGRQGVAATPTDHPNRAMFLSSVGGALQRRFERTGDQTAIDEAIDLLRQAVDITPANHPNLARHLSNLGGALRARFERTGDRADLDQTVVIGEDAVVATPPDHPARARYLFNLNAALRIRFERASDPADLDRAIVVAEQAIAATPADHPDLAAYLSALGSTLLARFERGSDHADLTQAIRLYQRAVAVIPTDHPAFAGHLANLGAAARLCFERTGNPTDLDQAITAGEQAVTSTPPDHPRLPRFRSQLGNALASRSRLTGDLADLAEAINQHRLAVAAAPGDHPARAIYLGNLQSALLQRFHLTADPVPLDEAVQVGQRALAALPAQDPDLVRPRYGVGLACRTRFERDGDQADLDAAIAHFRAGLELVSATPLWRVRCGVALAHLVAGRDWPGAARAWAMVLDLLPLVVDRSLSRDDRQHLLATFRGVGPSAAAAALALGNPGRAWEALEQGRGVLLGQALATAPDPELRREHPDLADQVDQARRDLNLDSNDEARDPQALDPQALDPQALGPRTRDPQAPGLSVQAVTALRRRAARDWATTVAAIRARPGFDRFGQPLTIDDLRAAAGPRTIVAITVDPVRCDALILGPGGVDHLPLPGLREADAVSRANQFQAATRDRDNYALREVLAWLADSVTGPILDHLGHTATPPAGARWPRVWWSPTGALSVLPIHATAAVLDRVVSSYTPTVALLARAAGIGALPGQPGVLVGIDHTPRYPPLGFATQEAREIGLRFGAAATLLVNEEATVARVRALLPAAQWAHFACHGIPARDPADSHLGLWDGPLPVREIAGLDLPNARLAYLSACTTAFGGAELPEEAIHIASAFQVAGFAHVVATLWPINDQLAGAVAADFYGHLALDHDPARALHDAVRRQRDRFPGLPLLWAPYIHCGAD